MSIPFDWRSGSWDMTRPDCWCYCHANLSTLPPHSFLCFEPSSSRSALPSSLRWCPRFSPRLRLHRRVKTASQSVKSQRLSTSDVKTRTRKTKVDPFGNSSRVTFSNHRQTLSIKRHRCAALRLAPGFQAELIYTVPLKEQGSWVSLTVDPQGRLVASDQNAGLYRLTLPSIVAELEAPLVERLDVDLGGAQGLLFAHGHLYAVVNGGAVGTVPLVGRRRRWAV